jgi:hypothetical protein
VGCDCGYDFGDLVVLFKCCLGGFGGFGCAGGLGFGGCVVPLSLLF